MDGFLVATNVSCLSMAKFGAFRNGILFLQVVQVISLFFEVGKSGNPMTNVP